MHRRRLLLIFTKPARPGRVKTRLVGELTSQQAAALHQAFLDDLLGRFHAGPFRLEIAWALDETEPLPERTPWGIGGRRQRGEGLGERLYTTLEEAGRRHALVAAIGSDHPELSLDTVNAAFEALETGSDVVLGPAADGGYYLIGVRSEKISPDLFAGIPWSTRMVFAESRKRVLEAGLALTVLEKGHDVDTPADLERLIQVLRDASSEPGAALHCPRTRDLLESWGRLRKAGVG